MTDAPTGPVARLVTELADAILDGPTGPRLRTALDAGEVSAPALVTDLARTAYRLLLVPLATRRGAGVTVTEALGGLETEVLVPDDLAHLQVPTAVGISNDVAALGALHEELLTYEASWTHGMLHLDPAGSGRKSAGAWFTPPRLVGHLLDEVLEPALDEASGPVSVLDPACGAGAFLVAAARRITARTGDLVGAVAQVHGVDLDPAVLELARVCLWLELAVPGERLALPVLSLRQGDALDLDLGEHDVVVGNPPFLNQLESLTVRRGERGPSARAYTDVSALFLARSLDWLRDGGRVGLVQPQSLLAARDSGDVRASLAKTCALESLWASDVPVFEAGVLTCAPVLRKAAPQDAVRRTHGPEFEPFLARPVTADDLAGEWSFLLVEALGVPEVTLTGSRTLGELAGCTADFRDQYYGLEGHVHEVEELPSGPPLVTSGLIDPAECLWGMRQTRFLKQRWQSPVVDVPALTPSLQRWAGARQVPKVLVGTQGKVLEAVVDEHGSWLPSVPVITVVPAAADLWRVLAVLLAPPVTAHAMARYAGTALTMDAVKLSASQVGRLPLPTVEEHWDAAASVVRRAQADAGARRSLLLEAGALMCRAYEVDESVVLPWWAGRLRKPR